MGYAKIIGEETKYYVTVEPFKTQHGYDAIRFVGEEVPETSKGFKYYSNGGEEIANLSRYTYPYRDNEFADHEDVIEPPKPSYAPVGPSQMDVMNSRIGQLAGQVVAITPYVLTKQAYIGDTECEFTDEYLPEGNITASVNADGVYVPCSIERTDTKIIIAFEELEAVATVTINIL